MAAVTRARPGLWLAAGLVAGIGLENKDLLALGMLALLMGMLLTTRRRALATRWPWLGLLVAVALWSPNLYWQATHYLNWGSAHGFPEVAMAHALQATHARLSDYALGLPLQLLDLGVLAVPLAGVGLVRLVRQPATRFLGLAPLLLLAYVLADIPGRAYYTDGLLFLGVRGWSRGSRGPCTARGRQALEGPAGGVDGGAAARGPRGSAPVDPGLPGGRPARDTAPAAHQR
ncbi:MAG: glycosyltransferase family 39 protein [Acidimicrobiales bacterium]